MKECQVFLCQVFLEISLSDVKCPRLTKIIIVLKGSLELILVSINLFAFQGVLIFSLLNYFVTDAELLITEMSVRAVFPKKSLLLNSPEMS